jgi:hypothetical protein
VWFEQEPRLIETALHLIAEDDESAPHRRPDAGGIQTSG